MRKIKTLVVDDNETFLRGAALMLNALPGVEVLAQVNSGINALVVVQAHTPDLVLLDFNMPDMNGIETVWRLRSQGYGGKIVLMSLASESDIREQRPNLDADAFIDKQHFAAGVTAAIERLFAQPAKRECT